MALPIQDLNENSQKVSRYRSTRQNPPAAETTPIAPLPPTSFTDPNSANSIQRSRSRYRRANTVTPSAPPPTDAIPTIKAQQARLAEQTTRSNGALKPHARAQAQVGQHGPGVDNTRSRAKDASPMRKKSSREDIHVGQASDLEERAKAEARRLMEREAERQRKVRERMAQQKEQERARKQEREEAKRRLAEEEMETRRKEEESQARREAEESVRRQRQQVARNRYQRGNDGSPLTQTTSQKSWEREQTSRGPQPELKSSGSKELFGMFKRKRGDAGTQQDNKLSKAQAYQAPFEDGTPTGAVPTHGVDAPISAVNAGERQVLIEANGSSIYLPVTPTTTPVDLIRSAASSLPGKVNPRASVLMENFGKVGVQRPLRKYEHVRDVMNSWDDDRQNSLVLLPSATGGNDLELDANYAPREQPADFACQLSYSQKPGKWDKRWVTLRQDGQVTVAKKPDMKAADQTNVCHISDFDIYTPAPKQLARKIRPPKKHCFAIKSQQKSNLFMSMESFVHFFCSSDKKTAALFYRAVQGWRSWYLVNVLGEGQKSAKKSEGGEQRTCNGAANGTSAPHIRGNSELGAFKPLVDLDVFNKNDSSNPPDAAFARQRTRSNSASQGQGFSLKSARASGGGGGAPPSSFATRYGPGINTSTDHARKTSSSNPNSPADENTFAPTGLLGRTYSKRQADAQVRETERSAHAFTQGPSLINDGLAPPPRGSIDQGPERLNFSSSPVGTTATSLKRTSSQRRPQQPLVDLTPEYREPPQHAKKGKGFYPEQVPAGGLVESATSPDEAIRAPAAADWRAGRTNTMRSRPPVSNRPGTAKGATGGGGGMERSMSLAQRTKSIKRTAPPAAAEGFQAGSLLDKVQKEGREHFDEGKSGTRFDRSRAEEVDVRYGEGA